MNDVKELLSYVPLQYLIWTIIILIALAILVYKCYPLIKKWFETARKIENERENIDKLLNCHTQQLEKLQQEIDKINKIVFNDQKELMDIGDITIKQQKMIEDSMEERELIIRSLLGVVQGLQEVGANGPTKKAEKEIQDYLVRKAHHNSEEVSL